MLRIAIQSEGRISQETLKMLDKVGVLLSIRDENPVLVRSINFPAEVLFVEKDLLPGVVEKGVADVGICGEYTAMQYGYDGGQVIKRLGYGQATLSLAVPQNIKYKGIEWFKDKTIATPYPDLLSRYMKSRGVRCQVRQVKNRVYLATQIGLADAICDRVHSGTTLLSHNMKEVETIMKSEAVMIVSPRITPQKMMILDAFMARIDATSNAITKRMVRMMVPTERKDEIVPLLQVANNFEVWSSDNGPMTRIEVLMEEKHLWDVVDTLRKMGAREIVVMQIDKLID